MKKLICLLMLGMAISVSAQHGHHGKHGGEQCENASGGCCENHSNNPYKHFTCHLPFEMPEVMAPQFPDRQVNLKDFGAVGDGIAVNTEAFAKAIDALASQGGGHLVVPAGVWFTGPIVMKSNIDLHLEMGAVILFSADDSLYPIIETSFEGLDTRRCQ